MSPMKHSVAGKSYFECQLADETSSLRVVGFDAAQQQKMAVHQQQDQAIIVENCEVKKARYGDSMEVVLKQATAVQCSPREMSASNSANVVALNDLSSLPDYNLVTVVIKVLKVYQKVEVKPGLIKQDITIANAEGIAKLTLWQKDVDTLKVNETYKLKDLTVRS